MKTPTNFIPIIGPLYADDLQNHSLQNWLMMYAFILESQL